MESLSLPSPRKSMIHPQNTEQSYSHDLQTSPRVKTVSIPQTTTKVQPSGLKQSAPLRAPNYDQRCRAATEASRLTTQERKRSPRKLFVPRSLQDFDDGGAFPEIHVAQYPRHMGNPHLRKKLTSGSGAQVTSRAIVNVQVDETGEVSYDAIVKSGTNSDKRVYSRLEDMQAKEAKQEDITLPTAEDEEQTTNRTQAALLKLLESKNSLNKPSGSAIANAETSKNIEEKTQFIKYTPRPDAPGYNPAAAQRVIQMVPAQVDPMMPPKHKHIKAPRGPAEDPIPVLHAPPTKLSKEERDQWNIPACISNWKNTRGYTIPLDKRLAADGRGLREHTINSNFATLSESLYVAERQARQEVRMRAQVQKKIALQERDRREEELRELASQARLERSGLLESMPVGGGSIGVQYDATERNDSASENSTQEREETDEVVAAQQRERLRQERRREREKELRQESNMELKKRKLETERDVSEKIALGVHTGTGGAGGEVDSRLYSQSAGMDSGFGADDEYNTYSKPLFDRQSGVSSSSIYRPTRGDTEYNADETYDSLVKGATSKFQPSRGFAGAESGGALQAGPRTAPVQFEKSSK